MEKKEEMELKSFMVNFLRKNGLFGKDVAGIMSDHVQDAMRYAVQNTLVGIETELYYGSDDKGPFVGLSSMLGDKKLRSDDEE